MVCTYESMNAQRRNGFRILYQPKCTVIQNSKKTKNNYQYILHRTEVVPVFTNPYDTLTSIHRIYGLH